MKQVNGNNWKFPLQVEKFDRYLQFFSTENHANHGNKTKYSRGCFAFAV